MSNEEGNKIIAEFDDSVVISNDKIYKYVRHGEHWALQGLKYHSSWDWFHGAWDKFKKIQLREDENDNFNDTYNKHLISISTAIIHFGIETAQRRLVQGILFIKKFQPT